MLARNSSRRAVSIAALFAAVVIAAAVIYLIFSSIQRTRQHEQDKQKAGAAASATAAAPAAASFDLGVTIVKAPDTFPAGKTTVCEVEVKNLSTKRIEAGAKDVEYTVGNYFSDDAKAEKSFEWSVGLPKSLAAGEATTMQMSCTPKQPMASGYVVFRVYANKKVDGQSKGAWASEAVSKAVSVK